MLQRHIKPTAKSQLQWIDSTYSLGDEIDRWCREISATADDAARPRTEVTLDHALEELNDLAVSPEDDWTTSARNFSAAGWLERLKAIQILITTHKLPYKVRVNTKTFQGFSSKTLPVEVKVVYEIDIPAGSITFLGFASYRPDDDENQTTQPW